MGFWKPAVCRSNTVNERVWCALDRRDGLLEIREYRNAVFLPVQDLPAVLTGTGAVYHANDLIDVGVTYQTICSFPIALRKVSFAEHNGSHYWRASMTTCACAG